MAFFEELGKKISQTSQNAVQKTKEMADLAKLNSAISEEEKKISSQYLQIGKLYVSVHESDYEENFTDSMMAIKESKEKIRGYRQQMKDIKGVVRCENCGAEVPNNVAFCSSCGTPIHRQEKQVNDGSLIKCEGCGQMVSREMRYCTVCGKAIAESIHEQEPVQSTEGES